MLMFFLKVLGSEGMVGFVFFRILFIIGINRGYFWIVDGDRVYLFNNMFFFKVC